MIFPATIGGRRVAAAAYALLLVAAGLPLVWYGGQLVGVGGSAYYLAAGLLLSASGSLLPWRRPAAARVYAVMLLGTLVWSLWEVGFDAWALVPRLGLLAVLGLGLANWAGWRRGLAWCVASVFVGAALHEFAAGAPVDPVYRAGITAAPARPANEAAVEDGEWRHYGGDAGGARYSRLAQLTPGNVRALQPAWRYDTSEVGNTFEATPLQVGDTLYLCTGANDVIALDAETGRERWRFHAGARAAAAILKVCRGVAYFEVPAAQQVGRDCPARIITNTVDARLIALDARSGTKCRSFGSNGETSLLTGMGDHQGRVIPGYYFVTSAPTVVRGKVVLGGWVSDAQYWGEPSGVIRAFDAVTGQFAWAFDMGRPDRSTEPPPGEHYTPSTPNAWAPMSSDPELGLVFVPTGNTTGSDYYGVQRRPFDDQYSSSVIALEADTGRVRWSFQTVHHDLWDYDVAPQPTAVDLTIRGQRVQALVQGTKTGEVFVLDRTTGQPLYRVEEQPAPTAGAVPGERVSPTQPASVELPAFRGPQLTERDSWGLTPYDQLGCRLQFKRARYEGVYTPPGTTPFLQYPGILGGLEWGGVSINPETGLMIVNASRIANYARLIPRAEADAEGRKPAGLGGHYMHRAQSGTPYAVSNPPFLSPLQVPCQRPPFGTLSAVDLGTGKLVWTRWLGSARDSGPLGVASRLPLPLGTPNIGGAVSTRSGLVFIGATQDAYLRAFAASDGALLWQARLPGPANATPMTYRSPKSGRQFVVVAAAERYVLAYALPASGD